MSCLRKVRSGIITAVVLIFIAGGIYWAIRNDYFMQIVNLIDNTTPSLLFIFLMLLLPVAGFPISIFLVLSGIKFGLFRAVLLWLVVVPIHTIIGYWLVGALRKPMVRLLNKKMGYVIPQVPEKHEALYSFVFLAVPGIPYAAKNYLLPLSGVKFRYCVTMNTIVQALMGVPFIVMGQSAADKNLTILLIAAGIFVVGFAAVWELRKRYGKKVQ